MGDLRNAKGAVGGIQHDGTGRAADWAGGAERRMCGADREEEYHAAEKTGAAGTDGRY